MVIGSSGHAKSVLEAADSAGFVVDGTISTENSDGDIGFASLISALHDVDIVTTALALGHGVNHVRFRAFEEVLSVFPQAQFPPIVHSSAWVSPTASLGRGSVVLAQASVGSGSTLGVGALINTGASLDHDSTLGDFASLGPGARTGAWPSTPHIVLPGLVDPSTVTFSYIFETMHFSARAEQRAPPRATRGARYEAYEMIRGSGEGWASTLELRPMNRSF